ncbi:uncharacterized protein PRCAT00002771001 [Priceomyces carsonii]|uniref:uncharacterized protein n=1 Tax=Priceomyces carsonii TaxID=28549 RepID=UPI002EDB9CEC|nr:unnamed protein product [Priceomyces carsonii]
MTVSAPKKFLCLCGYLQNGKIFAEKSSGIRKILTKKLNFQLDYIDPPNKIPSKESLPFQLADTEEEANTKWDGLVQLDINRCWWAAHNGANYEGFQNSLNYVMNYIQQNGPYDGIIAFSQGAALASIVTNTIRKTLPESSYFGVSILISGFVFTEVKNPEEDDPASIHSIENFDEYLSKIKKIDTYSDLFTPPTSKDFTTKVVIVYGENDNAVPPVRSQYLASTYNSENVKEFKHDGGHFVPNKKQFLNPIVDVISELFEKKPNL